MNTSTNASESAPDTLVRVMLQAMGGSPLPDINSPEYAQIELAIFEVMRAARPIDMHRLGCVAAKALLHYVVHGLQAQRTTALAQLAAKGGQP